MKFWTKEFDIAVRVLPHKSVVDGRSDQASTPPERSWLLGGMRCRYIVRAFATLIMWGAALTRPSNP